MKKHLLTQEDRKAGNIARWQGYQKQILNCIECGKEFSVPPSVIKKGKGKYCSQLCANRAKGKAMSVEKHFKQNGYIYIKNWEHPYRSKQNLVAEHRLIVEEYLGRYLESQEVVHHLDEDKHNNELYNLFLCKDDIEHRIVGRIDKQFLCMFNVARYQYWDDFKNFDITKDRQDQLQEMRGFYEDKLWLDTLCQFFDFMYEKSTNKLDENLYEWLPIPKFTSMEQLWLAFLFAGKYGKYWDGSDWVEQK